MASLCEKQVDKSVDCFVSVRAADPLQRRDEFAVHFRSGHTFTSHAIKRPIVAFTAAWRALCELMIVVFTKKRHAGPRGDQVHLEAFNFERWSFPEQTLHLLEGACPEVDL